MTKEEIFKKFRTRRIAEKRAKVLELCNSRTVLDVGCVGQDCGYENENWLHKSIRECCSEIIGVDIDPQGIASLRAKGYNILNASELNTLNRKFDVILMSDVIEHVDNPVSFLSEYSQYLAEKGIIIITTPNAHGIRNFTGLLIRNDYSVNSEHTLWFCPKTLTEVMIRAGLNFNDFYWMKEYFKLKDIKGLKFRIIYILNTLFMKMRPGFHPNFMYIVSK